MSATCDVTDYFVSNCIFLSAPLNLLSWALCKLDQLSNLVTWVTKRSRRSSSDGDEFTLMLGRWTMTGMLIIGTSGAERVSTVKDSRSSMSIAIRLA